MKLLGLLVLLLAGAVLLVRIQQGSDKVPEVGQAAPESAATGCSLLNLPAEAVICVNAPPDGLLLQSLEDQATIRRRRECLAR